MTTSPSRSPWPWLIPLFLASGCASLIYELVWFQMLQLVIGSTAVSQAVVLAAFMGGMSLGSLVLAARITPRIHPIRLWASLELCIGLLGIAVTLTMPWLARLYAVVVPAGLAGIVFRALFCAVCLLPPTILMGATLPTIARLAPHTSRGPYYIGLVYAANIVGAVLGALLAGFVVLRAFDSVVGTCVAAALNLAAGATGFVLPLAPLQNPASCKAPRVPARSFWTICVITAVSGFCALGAEVVWTRLLSLMLGATTYTFSIILAVFLLGLGLGNAAGAFVARRARRHCWTALGTCQCLLIAGIAWAAVMLAKSIPYWPINPGLSRSMWFNFQLDLVRCLWAVLPSAFLWGMSFPLSLAAAQTNAKSENIVGKLYAANTLGAILGAVSVSVLLIPWLGSRQTQRGLIVLSALSGLLALWRRPGRAEKVADPTLSSAPNPRLGFATLLALAAGTVLMAWLVPPLPWPVVAYGRSLSQKTELGTPLYVAEGMNASVAVTQLSSGTRNFHVSGKIEASTDQQDMRLQRMLGHLPALFHPDPRSVLVVGCGAGVTAGSFLVHPGIERVQVCEIEPLVPRAVARFFSEENYDVVQSSRVRFISDDGRHYLLTTRQKFDVITSDPIHPWVKGAANLYTKEYFELCKAHLNPGGIVTQWVPLYESSLAAVQSELATFFAVFPEGTIWSNEDLGAGYDLVVLGGVDPLEIDLETLQRRMARPDHDPVRQSLRDVGIRSAFSLVATYAGRARDLKPWLKHAQLNRERDLRLQYLAGLSLNAQQSDLIYTALSDYRLFPDDLFPGSNTWNDALRRTFEHKPESSLPRRDP